MQANNTSKAKSHCLDVFLFITNLTKEAQEEVKKIEAGEYDSNTTYHCDKTIKFAAKIATQLQNYVKRIEDEVTGVENTTTETDINSTQNKKECSFRKGLFSLKKEEDEAFTQDEFLEIYKIDMTEDFDVPNKKKVVDENENVSVDIITKEDEAKRTTASQEDAEINSDKNPEINSDKDPEINSDKDPEINSDKDPEINSDKGPEINSDKDTEINSDKETDIISNIDIEINEDGSVDSDGTSVKDGSITSDHTQEIENILNKIGCDTSDTNSESDRDSIFSIATVILDNNQKSSDESDFSDTPEQISDNNEDEKTANESEIEVNDEIELKECSVILEDFGKSQKSKNSQSGDGTDKEMREIENLLNLNTLKRKCNSTDVESAPNNKKQKTRTETSFTDEKETNSTETESDTDVTDCEFLATQEIDTNKNDNATICDMILENIVDVSDSSEIGSYDSSTDIEIDNKQKEKKINEINCNGKQGNLSEDLFSEIDEETRKKKKWRHDKLLVGKLTDGSTDDEKENEPVVVKPKKLRRRRQKSVELVLADSATDNSSDSDFSTTNISNESADDSTSSEVEFVSTDIKDSPESSPSKHGRRNIRSVQADSLLTESTKKAQREEEERRDRLQPLTQILTQISQEKGLVLYADSETKAPIITVDKNITERLKDHQKEGVRFMWNSCYESVERSQNSPGTGCILAHCMGLGKTFQVTALIHTLFTHSVTNTSHVLIVCPLSTVLNWDDEFRICSNVSSDTKKLNTYLITDGRLRKERHKIVANWYDNKGILIVGYESLQSLLNTSGIGTAGTIPKKVVQALRDPGPDLVICDEGHLIKNGNKRRAKTLMKINTKRRIILTGTPMQNNLIEYYHMVDFVKPNLLGTKKEFCNRFANPITNGGYDDSTEMDIKVMRHRSHVLHEYLKDTIQRYEMSELLTYLPEKLDYVLFVKLHPLQVELYKAYLETINQIGKRSKTFLPDYIRLKDVWTHPCILSIKEEIKKHQNKRKEIDTIPIEPEVQEDMPNEWWRSKVPSDVLTNIDYGSKLKIMIEIIEQCVRLDDKVLIFGSSLAELDAIEHFLQENGWKKNYSYLRMDGTMVPELRIMCCNKFNQKGNNPIKLFLLSHQVGGLGLNLVAANRIILMDVNFNPAVDNQSIFRTYRFGQHKPCYVYRLVSMGTMEEVVYERSVTKLAVSLRVVDEHQISRHYKSNDLQKMYRFNIYTDEERPVIKLPDDDVLATIIEKCKKEIFKYHEHKDLLENRPEEQLNEEEQKIAWAEYRKEQEYGYEQETIARNLKLLHMQQAQQMHQPQQAQQMHQPQQQAQQIHQPQQAQQIQQPQQAQQIQQPQQQIKNPTTIGALQISVSTPEQINASIERLNQEASTSKQNTFVPDIRFVPGTTPSNLATPNIRPTINKITENRIPPGIRLQQYPNYANGTFNPQNTRFSIVPIIGNRGVPFVIRQPRPTGINRTAPPINSNIVRIIPPINENVRTTTTISNNPVKIHIPTTGNINRTGILANKNVALIVAPINNNVRSDEPLDCSVGKTGAPTNGGKTGAPVKKNMRFDPTTNKNLVWRNPHIKKKVKTGAPVNSNNNSINIPGVVGVNSTYPKAAKANNNRGIIVKKSTQSRPASALPVPSTSAIQQLPQIHASTANNNRYVIIKKSVPSRPASALPIPSTSTTQQLPQNHGVDSIIELD